MYFKPKLERKLSPNTIGIQSDVDERIKLIESRINDQYKKINQFSMAQPEIYSELTKLYQNGLEDSFRFNIISIMGDIKFGKKGFKCNQDTIKQITKCVNFIINFNKENPNKETSHFTIYIDTYKNKVTVVDQAYVSSKLKEVN